MTGTGDWRPWWLRILNSILYGWWEAGQRREASWKHKEAMARIRWAKACEEAEMDPRPAHRRSTGGPRGPRGW